MDVSKLPAKQSLENTKRVIGNILVLLKEGTFKGDMATAHHEAQAFIGNMFNQVKSDLEAMNATAQEPAAETPATPAQ